MLLLFLTSIVLLHLLINYVMRKPNTSKIDNVKHVESMDCELRQSDGRGIGQGIGHSDGQGIGHGDGHGDGHSDGHSDGQYEMYKTSEENLLKWFDDEVEKKVSNTHITASNADNSEPLNNTFMKSLEDKKTQEIDSFNDNDYTYAPFKF